MPHDELRAEARSAPRPDEPPYSLIGSCVTRDAADLGSAPLPPPVHFFSRTRIQSIVSDPTPLDPGEIRLDSNFQRRVTAEDHDKTAARTLPKIDHPIVIDLIDERSPLARTAFGLITATSYFKQAGLADRGTLEPVPNDLELAADGPFASACARLAALLPAQPVIIHRAYWAIRDSGGNDLAEKSRAKQANRWLKGAYRILEAALGDRAVPVRPEPELRVADPGHRWGLAPYHYPAAYYTDVSVKIRTAIAAART